MLFSGLTQSKEELMFHKSKLTHQTGTPFNRTGRLLFPMPNVSLILLECKQMKFVDEMSHLIG